MYTVHILSTCFFAFPFPLPLPYYNIPSTALISEYPSNSRVGISYYTLLFLFSPCIHAPCVSHLTQLHVIHIPFTFIFAFPFPLSPTIPSTALRSEYLLKFQKWNFLQYLLSLSKLYYYMLYVQCIYWADSLGDFICALCVNSNFVHCWSPITELHARSLFFLIL